MGDIKVDVVPPDGMAPAKFFTELALDTETIYDVLIRKYGDGTLWDPKGVWVRPDPARQLDAGDYIFYKNKSAQGWAASQDCAQARPFRTALQGFATTPTWMYGQKSFGGGSRAFSDVSAQEACAIAHFFGFSVCNGHKLQRLDTPPPGTAECGSFPLGSFPGTDTASADLAEFHHLNLQKMSVPMGGSGLRVLDVHSRKKLLALCAGADKQWYTGGIDSAVVPCGEADGCAAKHIRVGFVHQQEDEHASNVAPQGDKADMIDGAVTAPLNGALGQMVMTSLAAAAMNDAPLDLVATDGTHFTLYRMRNRDILVYEWLTATEAYYALAVALEQYGLVRSLPRDDLPTLPTSTTEPHRMLTQKLEKDCGVDSARLQNKTDIILSPSSSLDDGTFH